MSPISIYGYLSRKNKKLEKKYLVSNITSDGEIARVHLISEHGVDEKGVSEAVPSLEDVYLYHFGMERD